MENLMIDERERNLYLRDLLIGKIQGPLCGDPTIDKNYLIYFSEEDIKNFTSNNINKTAFQYGYDARKHNLRLPGYNFYGAKFTYEEYYRLVYNNVKSLKYMGIKKNEIVLVNSPNSMETYAFIDALSYIGAIPSIFDPRAKDDELITYCKEGNAKTILTMDAFVPNLEKIMNKTNIKNIVVMDITTYMNPILSLLVKANSPKIKLDKSYISWKQFVKYGKNNTHSYDPNPYQSGSLFSIAHTSGTSSGISEGIKIRNTNINAIGEQYRLSPFHFKEGDSFHSPTPIHLIYGLSLQRTAHALGLVNYIQAEYNPEMTAKLVLKKRINNIGAGTADADAIKEALQKNPNHDASHIYSFATGGGKYHQTAKDECIKELRKHNCKINVTEGYGLSENTGPAITCFPNAYKEDSVGVPFPYTNIMIIDPDTLERVKPGEAGELLIEGPSITEGYIGLDRENVDLFLTIDGRTYIRTKDKVRMDQDGFVFFEGRYSNIIPLYTGENISPFPIEEAVRKHYAIKDCIVVGMKDQFHLQGEVPVVCIVLKEEYRESNLEELEAEIQMICRQQLKEEYVPQKLLPINLVPMTKNGKADYIKAKTLVS